MKPRKNSHLKAVPVLQPPLRSVDEEILAWADASSNVAVNLRTAQPHSAIAQVRECLRQTERLAAVLERY